MVCPLMTPSPVPTSTLVAIFTSKAMMGAMETAAAAAAPVTATATVESVNSANR